MWVFRFKWHMDLWFFALNSRGKQITLAKSEVANAPGRFFGYTLEIVSRRRYGGGNQSFRSIFRQPFSRCRGAVGGNDARNALSRIPASFPDHLRHIETPETASTCCTRQGACDDVSDKRRRSSSQDGKMVERERLSRVSRFVVAEISFTGLIITSRGRPRRRSWWIRRVRNWRVTHSRDFAQMEFRRDRGWKMEKNEQLLRS